MHQQNWTGSVAHIPATYSDLKAVIAAKYNGLPRQLKKFGRYILDNSDVLALETVTTVAERADVQPSTIIRFAKAIGYEGFSDLQQICRERLMEDTTSYRERVRTLPDDGRDGANTVLDDFALSGMEALEHLRLNTPPEKLADATELLKSAGDIYLLAQGRSYAVVQYLYYALSRLEVRCVLVDGAGGMLGYQTAKASSDDVVIAISFTPYTPAVSTAVSELAGRGVPVISITDSPLSPLAEPSSVSFEITESSDQAFRTLIAPMCLAQSLIVYLGQALSGGQTTDQNSTEGNAAA